jgi:hypothetical protein
MSLETGGFIKNLVSTNPEGTDPKSQGDDHLRLIKAVLKSQFGGFTDGIPITRTESQINAMLLQGAYGLGGIAIPFNNADALVDETKFYFLSGTPISCPPGAADGDTMIHHVASNLVKTQLWISANSSQLWTRGFYVDHWTTWDKYAKGTRQTSIVDATAQALMMVGAFGLGGLASVLPAVNIDGPPPYSTIIGIVPGTAGILPPSGASSPGEGDVILQLRYNVAVTHQIYLAFGGNAPGVWYRTVINGAASAWGSLVPCGTFQNWLNLTATRAKDALYTNDLGRPIQVSIGGTTAGTSGNIGLVTGAGVPIQQVTWGSVSGNLPFSLSGIIPPGGTYKCTGGGSLIHWSELR